MKPVRWRIYAHQKHLGDPSILCGAVTAETKADALEAAGVAYPKQQIEVVSEIAWQAMGTKERALFEGTYEIAEETDPHPNIREAKCQECGGTILYGRDHKGKWRNPPRLCRGPCARPLGAPRKD